mmetsp:Transcript_12947/g.39912  ORF Transcript_12947/g.39912 Transcript_12947/m.39912 type:complete len:339 (+) Transcript_12947:222-1238(+)
MRPTEWLSSKRRQAGYFGTRMKVGLALGCVANLVASCATILMSKYLQKQHDFDHIIFLTAAHFVATTVGMRLMLLLGVFEYKRAERRTVMRVALGSLASIGFFNLNLKQNSLGFYQMSKLACIPATLLCAWVLGGERVDLKTTATLVPLVGGLYVAEVHDHTATPLGTAYAAVAVVATVFSQRVTASSQQRLGCDSNQLLYHTAPLIAAGMIVCCPLAEDVADLASLDWTFNLKLDVLLSSGLALGANVTNYYVLGRTSPLTYQVLGHLKTIVVIWFSVVVFGLETNFEQLAGIAAARAGTNVAVPSRCNTRACSCTSQRNFGEIRDYPRRRRPWPAS